jgi:hypothetical protein
MRLKKLPVRLLSALSSVGMRSRPVLSSPMIRCAVPPYKRQRAPMMAPFPIRKIFCLDWFRIYS